MRAEFADLPHELIATLSCDPSEDFTCQICGQEICCRWNARGPRREVAPICWSCENVTGYRWNGGAYHRTKPQGGSHRDKRNALRVAALADAIEHEIWRMKHVA